MPRPNALQELIAELFTYGAFGALMGATLPLVALSSVRHRGEVPRRQGRWIRRVGRAVVRVNPLWDFSIEGEAPRDVKTRPYVVVANHLSLADPFLLSSLPWDMQWVAKESLFRAPLMGWILHLGGDIALRRGSKESVVAMMDRCRRALDGGLSVMLFPEGRRADVEGVAPFKDGAFELAIQQHVPVIPVAIAGTERAMRKGSGRLGAARAKARILPPLSTEWLTPADLPALRDRARDAIVAAHADLSRQLA